MAARELKKQGERRAVSVRLPLPLWKRLLSSALADNRPVARQVETLVVEALEARAAKPSEVAA